jgi:hypothetical protein
MGLASLKDWKDWQILASLFQLWPGKSQVPDAKHAHE